MFNLLLWDKIKDLISKKETIYFDVDGTLIHNGILTQLGQALVESQDAITVLTFGGWDCDMLRSFGLNVIRCIVAGEALASGLADLCDTTETGISKKVPTGEWLVDNEDHPLTTNLIKVSF